MPTNPVTISELWSQIIATLGGSGSTVTERDILVSFNTALAAAFANVSPLLAVTQYAPADQATYTVVQTDAGAVVDATNLSIIFKAPPSGTILIQASILCSFDTALNAAVAEIVMWFATHGSSTVMSQGEIVAAITGGQSSLTLEARGFYSNIVTGLTPGQSYHWDLWAGTANGAARSEIWVKSGFAGDSGPAEFYVWAVPSGLVIQ